MSWTSILFPAMKLRAGEYMRIGMELKEWTPDMDSPYPVATPTAMTRNPWTLDGVPSSVDAAAADNGIFGSDAVEFTFYNVPIKSGSTDTLFDVLTSHDPLTHHWAVYVWFSSSALSFPATPSWTAEADSIAPDGEAPDLLSVQRMRYKVAVRNWIAVGERIDIKRWFDGTGGSDGFLRHGDVWEWDYDPTASPPTLDLDVSGGVFIDGTQIEKIYHNDGATQQWIWLGTPQNGEQAGRLYFWKLHDILYEAGRAMGCTTGLNNAAGTGTVDCPWQFKAHGSATWYNFSDLIIPSGLAHSDGNTLVFDQSFGLFDRTGQAPYSWWDAGNINEVVKSICLSFGMTASVELLATQVFLFIRETELDVGEVIDAADALVGVTVEEGMRTSYGFRVVINNNGEIAEGATDDRSLDIPFLSPSRIAHGGRWLIHAGDTDDLPCLYGSVFIYDATTKAALSIEKIRIARDGVNRVTASKYMPVPPDVSVDITGLTKQEKIMYEAGSLIGKACMAYWFNGTASFDTDPVGVFRPNMRAVTLAVRSDSSARKPGHYIEIGGKKYVVREAVRARHLRTVQFSADRGF